MSKWSVIRDKDGNAITLECDGEPVLHIFTTMLANQRADEIARMLNDYERLRAALVEIKQLLNENRENDGAFQSWNHMQAWKVATQALSTTTEPINAENTMRDRNGKNIQVGDSPDWRNRDMTNDKKASQPLWWMLECPKAGEPCYCKEECMYLRQKSGRIRTMTRDEILAMEPGRELDALVAEKVLGWRKKTFPGGGGGFTAWVDVNEKVMKLISNSTMSETCYRCDYFRPSTDIAAAWEVWEHNRPEDWIFDLSYLKGQYYAEINKPYVGVLAKVRTKSAAESMVKCRLLAKLAVMEGEKDD